MNRWYKTKIRWVNLYTEKMRKTHLLFWCYGIIQFCMMLFSVQMAPHFNMERSNNSADGTPALRSGLKTNLILLVSHLTIEMTLRNLQKLFIPRLIRINVIPQSRYDICFIDIYKRTIIASAMLKDHTVQTSFITEL